MNKKGQTLVVFIILIPFLLMLGAYIVDNSMIVYKNIRLKNVTKDIIKVYYQKGGLAEEEIKDIYLKNDIPVDNLVITVNNQIINIKIKYEVEAIFGKLIDFNSYDIECSLKGYKENNNIQIKEE